jgi:protein-glucosylgalactosylhydroxylysine glucosidase
MKYILFFLLLINIQSLGQKINRKNIFDRQSPSLNKIDSLGSFSVGNGKFAFTLDITGLQTFPEYYQNGIPLGTQTEWAWHSFPNHQNYKIEETLDTIKSHGRSVLYTKQWPNESRQGQAANYLRQNPHRIHLASIGWQIIDNKGHVSKITQIKDIDQKLNVWNGTVYSTFFIDGQKVEVVTKSSQTNDAIGIEVKSELLSKKRLKLNLRFSNPQTDFLDNNVSFEPNILNTSAKKINSKKYQIERKIDELTYYTTVESSIDLMLNNTSTNQYLIEPISSSNTWSFTINFSKTKISNIGNYQSLANYNDAYWLKHWNTTGIIDFGSTTDPRAFELERRMVLSLYQTKINCGGNMPPQETGLVQNSWFGKPHLEMAWWHGVHFSLWNKPEVLENHLKWYLNNISIAKNIASRQGFKGIRWQKMTDLYGNETPSSVGAYLIWQQVHPIYFAELMYKNKPSKETLVKYSKIVSETANFMASFAFYDENSKRYILGPGIIPAQERFKPQDTYNPTYELAYWRWGLEIAQLWQQRMNNKRINEWDLVLEKLSKLPVQDNLYLFSENAKDSYSNQVYLTDHPSVLMSYGFLPKTKDLDILTFKNTFSKIWEQWHWEDTWGWDFPMVAMTAIRLKDKEKALDALLMPVLTNTYLINGHNYQDKRLRLYLPGNGGFLTALAMMAIGTDENKASSFPDYWKVKYENLKPIF